MFGPSRTNVIHAKIDVILAKLSSKQLQVTGALLGGAGPHIV